MAGPRQGLAHQQPFSPGIKPCYHSAIPGYTCPGHSKFRVKSPEICAESPENVRHDQQQADFHTHTLKTSRLEPRPIILLDGVLLFALEPVRSRLDITLFVDVPADFRLARRLLRDVAERGRSPRSVLEQYLATVRPMHARFVEPWKTQADYCITNEQDFEPAPERLLTAVRGDNDELRFPHPHQPV
ncbi:MAG: hypothetical protein KDI44_07035 [Thiothrix sp.]|nr:hypothetical protein [Thiothrix sp.]HPQ94466.1 hypothetical protein [Thiolinea sp.]